MIAQELLNALDNILNMADVDHKAIWALSEYLKGAWKDDLNQSVRPFNLGKALSDFFVDLSQHRLPPKISQHSPDMEAILLKTFGSADGSLGQFWMKCAGILKFALEPYPAYSKDFQGYFDLLMQSSHNGNLYSVPPAAPPPVSDPAPIQSVEKTQQPLVPLPTPAVNASQIPVQPPQPKAASEPKTFPKNAYLVLQGTRVIPLNQPMIKIGRQLDNHIILEDPRVSRSHAQLKLINDHFVIFDLNSTGGTFINGQRISQSVLYPGDVISLAGVKFIYSQELPAKPGEVRIIELGSPFAADRPTAVMHREKLKPGDKDAPDLPKTAPLRK